MRKQKAEIPVDPNIKTPKIRKLATQTYTQNKNSSQTQSLPQLINRTHNQTTDLTVSVDLDQLMEIWKHVKQSQFTLSQDQVRFTELEERYAQAEMEIKQLQSKLCQGQEENAKMAKYIEEKCKMRDAIIEKQKLACDLKCQVREHIDAITKIQEYCEESRDHTFTLYTNVNSKQDEMIQNLIEQFNNQALDKIKGLKDQLELKCNELLIVQTKFQQVENETKEKTEFVRDVNTKREDCKIRMDNNKQKYNEKTAQMLVIINEIEENLKIEDEAMYKLVAENNESSKKYDQLLLEYKALQVIDTGYASQMECLKSSLLELKAKEESLINELDELQKKYLALNSNRDLESADYRKQLQDLTSIYTEETNKLREAIVNNNELSKTVAKTVEDSKWLKVPLKNKDDEITKMRVNLSDALEKNQELSADIQSLEVKLIAGEKQICQDRLDFESYKTKWDENTKNEAEIGAEIHTTEQQLSDKCEEIGELIEKARDEKIGFFDYAKKFKRDIEQKDKLINKVQKAAEVLKQEIERNKSEYTKKIEDARHSSKQCELAGHEKQIKEQNTKIDILNKELSDEKLKKKRINTKKNETENKEKEKHDSAVKKLQSNHDYLKEKLSFLHQDTEQLRNELKEAEALNEARNTRETVNSSPVTGVAADAKLETKSKVSMPKPILRSPMIRDSPLKIQKVQFDLGSCLNLNSLNGLDMAEEAERRYAVSASTNRPDWAKIRVPMTSQELKTTIPVPTVVKSTEPRKFFKEPRMQKKLTTHINKK